ncbi:RHS repeat-associated core domain-containing protein [Streptomyces wuyuanensis]|uniref:RHS repeat-associated core domain-containing protein n=1 Tax=Streptomyces wuyuanensis TaxID=1196353 RepID=A0A1G9XA16_9ACTN|nr:RHS repeat-associated core domain-containing protein [Streptomyces wuyuanensis]
MRRLWPARTRKVLTPSQASQEAIDECFFAIITDLVGTPSELIDESGELAWHTRSTLWGTTTWARSSTAYTPLRFPGQYFDPETGLHYNFHRHYDPETARYTTVDPLGLSPCIPPETVINTPEVIAPKPLKPHQVMSEWENFLGDGPYTNIHPRTGQPDPNRLVSADGTRSIRLGDHEMNSKPTKFHFHKETWTFIASSNTSIVDNTMVRVPLGLK